MVKYQGKKETILKHLAIVVLFTYALGAGENLKMLNSAGSTSYISVNEATGAMLTFTDPNGMTLTLNQRVAQGDPITKNNVEYSQFETTSVVYGKVIDYNFLAIIFTKQGSSSYHLQVHTHNTGNLPHVYNGNVIEENLGTIGGGAPSFDIDSVISNGYLYIAATANGYFSG